MSAKTEFWSDMTTRKKKLAITHPILSVCNVHANDWLYRHCHWPKLLTKRENGIRTEIATKKAKITPSSLYSLASLFIMG